MASEVKQEIVRHVLTVQAPIERAFQTFTQSMTDWWPTANTFGKDNYESVSIEPKQGGRWFERDRDGQEILWGKVLAWNPPYRVVLTWQIDPTGQPEPDPAKASVVEIRFIPEGPSVTQIAVEHREFENHGKAGAALWREAMDSVQGGWPHFLELYAATLKSDQDRRWSPTS